MRKFARRAAGIAALVATSALVGGGIAQADAAATPQTTQVAQSQPTTSSDVSPQETYHSWYWDRDNCVRAGIDQMMNNPHVTDYRCQYVGLYYRLLVTYR